MVRPPHPIVVQFFVHKLYVLLTLIGIYIIACKDVDFGAVAAIAFGYLHLRYLSVAAAATAAARS
jgi:hypothetical protein